ncbi:hypothetical protein DQ04_09601020 [Trypanosoma grayi]|uniref:hypothetical protein n=1 Tax=Trypanosoma grayi TaxID=71804 RepID=UPI0004F43951|nr:hypothetical protein DQ04_09601020 [Trypanosoma grayi]KEG07505.1 hypothetical protein DQ04_09601020 [Trypanosoma grayi]
MDGDLFPSIVAEVVAHAIDCFLLAVERQSLEDVKQCAETACTAVSDAYHKQPRKQEHQQQQQRSSVINVREWLCVLDSMISTALPRLLAFLQRLHASDEFGALARTVSTTLVNFVFCSITLCRCVGCDGVLQQEEELLRRHTELRQELSRVLGVHFPLIVYNAEQQLWQLEATTHPIDAAHLPSLYTVPRTAACLSSHDGWVWLLLAATTRGMIVFSPLPLGTEEVRQTGVTSALLAMNPQDVFDAPFGRRLVEILLAVYTFSLKRWMMRLPVLAEALQRWGKADAMPSSVTPHSEHFHHHDHHHLSSSSSSSTDEMMLPSEVCIVVCNLLWHVSDIIVTAGPMLKLLRLLSQLGVVRVFFVTHQSTVSADAAASLALKLSEFLVVASERVFLRPDRATCHILPCETSVPYLQLTLLDLAAHALEEVKSAANSALPARRRSPSAHGALIYAYRLRSCGAGAVECEGADAAQVDASFVQSFVLGLEEVFSCLHTVGYSAECASSLHHFFGSVQKALCGTAEERLMNAQTLRDAGGRGCPAVLSSGVVSALEHVLSLYEAVVRPLSRTAAGDSSMPQHRCYWLLAVSYLRLSGSEVRRQQEDGATATTTADNSSVFCCCRPSESAHWLQLDRRGSSCSSYEEWVQLRRLGQQVTEKGTPTVFGSASTLRDRLLSAALRFLLLALREAIRVEAAERDHSMRQCGDRTSASTTPSEVSLSNVYSTAFTRFLLMMDHVQAAKVVYCSEACSRTITECRSALAWEKNANGLITEEEVNAARTYQLAVSLFLI